MSIFKPEPPQFLTRDQLAFQEGRSFSLRIVSHGAGSGTVRLRGMTKEGSFTLRHSHTNSGAAVTSTFRIPDVPIWLTADDADFEFSQGHCFVQVSILVDNDPLFQPITGYVYLGRGLSWPNAQIDDMRPGGGRIRTFTGTDRAANVQIAETVPDTLIWKIRAIRFTLVTDANAANRRVHLEFRDGSTPIFEAFASVDQIANTTRVYSCAPYPSLLTAGDDNDILIPIPADITLQPGDGFVTTVTNFQVGDNFGAPVIFVEEFVTPF